jgi:hypothetical protein
LLSGDFRYPEGQGPDENSAMPGYEQEKTQAPMGGLDQREVRLKDLDQYAGQISRCYSDAEILAQLFSYHPPTVETLQKFSAINQAAKNFAEVILQNCPPSADRSAAIRQIREARMTANAAISLNGLSL